MRGLQEGGSGGTSYPGPDLGGPGLRGHGRVKVVASSFGPTEPNLSEDLFFFWSSPNLGQKPGPNLSEDLFFWSSPNFGQKPGPNLSEDLFFLVFT